MQGYELLKIKSKLIHLVSTDDDAEVQNFSTEVEETYQFNSEIKKEFTNKKVFVEVVDGVKIIDRNGEKFFKAD